MLKDSQIHNPNRQLLLVYPRVVARLLAAIFFIFCCLFADFSTSLANGTISLLGYLDVPFSAANTDVWGWLDPSTQIEYALVCNTNTGLHIVDVSDPANPTIVSTIDSIPRFDIKVWEHYAYTVDGNYFFAGSDGRITDISDPANPIVVGSIPPGHNIFIDDNGFLYLTYPGLKIFDLNPDPTNPQLVWNKVSVEGHDATVIGDRLYDFHGMDGTFIYDITSRTNPILLGAITDTTITYHHSGWTSADESYLFITDELALHPAPDIVVFDISNPATPIRVAEIADSNATVHNCYRIGDFLYVAYFTAGFRVYDITDPTNPLLADEYDTTPLTGEGLCKGSWGCYPFASSGNIYVNDRPEGFFIFLFEPATTVVRTGHLFTLVLKQNYPNPFNPSTTISFTLPKTMASSLKIYNVEGKLVRTLVDGILDEGYKEYVWNGCDDQGNPVSSGIYFYRLKAGDRTLTKKMVLLK